MQEEEKTGAGRGNRTPKGRSPADFESAASASSAIPAWGGTSVWHRPAGACHWPLFRAARRFFQHQAAEQQREGEERERNESGDKASGRVAERTGDQWRQEGQQIAYAEKHAIQYGQFLRSHRRKFHRQGSQRRDPEEQSDAEDHGANRQNQKVAGQEQSEGSGARQRSRNQDERLAAAGTLRNDTADDCRRNPDHVRESGQLRCFGSAQA